MFNREHRSNPFPEPIIPAFPGMGTFGGGRAPSITSAMQMDAVWACVTLLSNVVSMLTLEAFTKRGGSRFPIPDPPFLRHPSDDASITEWIYMVMVSLLLRGNAYGIIVAKDAFGRPTQIELQSPDSVRLEKVDGVPTYYVNGKVVEKARIFHIRAFRMPGSPLGLSPIAFAAAKIHTDSAAGDFGLGFFNAGGHPSSILSSDVAFNADQAKKVKDSFLAAVKGREPAVLSGGLKYHPIQVSPNDSQFLETQKFSGVGIARLFHVPPNMVAMSTGDSMTYSNDSARTVDFLTFSVQHWLTLLESALEPILAGQQHFRFDVSVLLRTDMETLVKTGAIAIASKQLTPDEVRAMQDRPPLTPEQLALMDLVPLTVTPAGMPRAHPVTPDPAPTEGAAA
jgi:HK97 family phage portal protein